MTELIIFICGFFATVGSLAVTIRLTTLLARSHREKLEALEKREIESRRRAKLELIMPRIEKPVEMKPVEKASPAEKPAREFYIWMDEN